MRQIKETRERRYIVKRFDRSAPEIVSAKRRLLEDGYFETCGRGDFRVRIINGAEASLDKVTGFGALRRKETLTTDIATASFLLDSCSDRIEKVRRRWPAAGYGDWKLDYFFGPLKGLVVLELDYNDALIEPANVARPGWVLDWTDVTSWLTNRHLARIARDLDPASADDRPVDELLPKRLSRVVLTGGPCSGKSSAMAALQTEIGGLVHVVPETATIIIATVGAKPPRDAAGLRRFQRTIYQVQSGFEAVSELQAVRDGKKALLIDRGTVDNAAYIAGGVKEFEKVCSTEVAREYANYDLVVQLAVPPQDVYDRKCANNPARSEDYAQARELDRRIRAAWSGHPNYRYIENGRSWDHKLDTVRAVIGTFLTAH